MAERAGATVTVRMPDLYAGFPYPWVSLEDRLEKVDGIASDMKDSGATHISGYEIWNEPNWTWEKDEAEPFDAVWKATFDKIRAANSDTDIIGPSIARWISMYLPRAGPAARSRRHRQRLFRRKGRQRHLLLRKGRSGNCRRGIRYAGFLWLRCLRGRGRNAVGR